MLWLMIALLLAAEVVLAHGGELDGPPSATVVAEGEEIVAYGFAEVPAKSRMQAAEALANAKARSELLAMVRAGVADVQRDFQSNDSQQVERITAQVASGVLPGLSPARHGWRTLQRDGDAPVLQVWSRLTAKRSALFEALAKAFASKDLAAAAAARVGAKK
jgi:hypothetical protein